MNKEFKDKVREDFQQKLEGCKAKTVPFRKDSFTQLELANLLGVTRQHIINFEKGKSNDPFLVYCYKKLFLQDYRDKEQPEEFNALEQHLKHPEQSTQ